MSKPLALEEVMDRVAKLLRLARSDNPHEAASAAAKAQEILARYSIDQATIDLDGDSDEPPEAIADFSDTDPLDAAKHNFARWRLMLASLLCEANGAMGTVISTTAGKRLGVIGRPSDVGKVRYMYAWLTQEIDRMAAIAGKSLGRTWTNNYRLGAVEGIGEQLRAANRKAAESARAEATSSAALIRVDKAIAHVEERAKEVDAWVQQNRGNFAKRNWSRSTYDTSARAEGFQAGAAIDLGARVRISSTGGG